MNHRGEGVSPLNHRSEGVPPLNLTNRVKSIIDQLDELGRWIEPGQRRRADEDNTVSRAITTRTFITNIRTLSAYIAAAR